MTAQIFSFFEIWGFFNFFFLNLDIKKVNQSLNYQTCSGVAARVHSGISSLASKYGFPYPYGFLDMSFLIYFFFLRKFRSKKTNTSRSSQPILGSYQGKLRGCKFRVQV